MKTESIIILINLIALILLLFLIPLTSSRYFTSKYPIVICNETINQSTILVNVDGEEIPYIAVSIGNTTYAFPQDPYSYGIVYEPDYPLITTVIYTTIAINIILFIIILYRK